MENVIVALSNLYAVRAMMTWPHFSIGYTLTTLSAAASICYHLIEHQKHNMPGLGTGSWEEHFYFLNFDRLCAATLSIYLLMHWQDNFYWPVFAISLGSASELFHVQPKLQSAIGLSDHTERIFYMVAHSAWHVAAFHCAYMVALHKAR